MERGNIGGKKEWSRKAKKRKILLLLLLLLLLCATELSLGASTDKTSKKPTHK
jgi:hypothetical protein